MLCDYEYYQSEYLGSMVPAERYPYLAERAQDILAPFIPLLASTDAAQRALKRCACALCESLYGDISAAESGDDGQFKAPVASETISGYYSVTYGLRTEAEKSAARNRLVNTYLAPYITRAARTYI